MTVVRMPTCALLDRRAPLRTLRSALKALEVAAQLPWAAAPRTVDMAVHVSDL
jgi:hypothetical protein